MQKKVIISIVTVNVFLALMAFVLISDGNKIENQMNNLNDNQIRMYNKAGFTLEEMKAVKKLDGVDTATFNNRNIFPTYNFLTENNSQITITGMTIEPDNEYQKNIDYIAGSYLTGKYQVVITKSLADELIAEGTAKDYNSLIGKDMVNGLKIVGVYPDPNYSQVAVNYVKDNRLVVSDYVEPYAKRFTNSFMLFNAGFTYKQQDAINEYNNTVAYAYENKTDDYDTYVHSDEYYEVDYKKSIANGAKNLIDPNTSQYGKTFNQFVTLNTGDDRDAVVSSLKSIFPDAAVITADTKLGDIVDTKLTWLRFIMFAIPLELLILMPTIKNGKKRK